MSDRNPPTGPAGPSPARAPRSLPDHPVRIALLNLLAESGTLTSTEAAARLGHSSGLCSFHLRQLARHGLIEEVPHQGGGRARPWRLRWGSPAPSVPAAPDTAPSDHASSARSREIEREAPESFPALARDLEDESYRQWLTHRHQAPAEWQRDDAFSAVLHLTPAEAAELTASVRRLFAAYRDRERDPAARPRDAVTVAVVNRLFPLVGGAFPVADGDTEAE
ncbi:winged helix-turn-helix domain-containing protein [Streptomyces mobaraensis]|uniref:Putative transcriptional regulator n=1 Tax=Streptomyces mobaraensis (strain ATCC 29032 / DSM 40847 / JCM 4168 / NBRC 13819 / NCIMB 11159 / IPCR 16-22) TaxID=1223523 RepID=M3C0F7_STRM1|nr:helix-turn-helix domain-containing protein [Streptomyces mobaraensis]EME97490.1 putative transcriptional regulator [Streptomyces mobaraensis NBRC 13819 = DSM 40847]